METIVCVKWVPFTSGCRLSIAPDGRSIVQDELTFYMNEWDNYALEEAVRLKQAQGGSVTALTVGPPEADNILFKCLASGADKAVRVWDPALAEADGRLVAQCLARVIETLPHDLVLAGALADDDAAAQVGGLLAALLGIPACSVVTRIEVGENALLVQREMEGGLAERYRMSSPCLLTVQTGINQPRYVTLRAILGAKKKGVEERGLEDLGLSPQAAGQNRVRVKKLGLPELKSQAVFLPGPPEESAARLVDILHNEEKLI